MPRENNKQTEKHLWGDKLISKREQTSLWHKKYITPQNKIHKSLKNHVWNIP